MLARPPRDSFSASLGSRSLFSRFLFNYACTHPLFVNKRPQGNAPDDCVQVKARIAREVQEYEEIMGGNFVGVQRAQERKAAAAKLR